MIRVRPDRRPGFTLLELLVSAAIIGVLIGLTMSAVQRVRVTATRAACLSRVGQLAVAVHAYTVTHGRLPRGCDYMVPLGVLPMNSQCAVSWQTSLLPHLEQAALWQQAMAAHQADPLGLDPAHNRVQEVSLEVLTCPTESRRVGGTRPNQLWGISSYRGVAGTKLTLDDGSFHPNLTVRPTDYTDGTSNTLLVGERPAGPNGVHGAWYSGWGYTVCSTAQLLPTGLNSWMPPSGGCAYADVGFRPGTIEDICDTNHYWSAHSGGATFAMADGSAHFIRYEAAAVLPALATRAGGETATVD